MLSGKALNVLYRCVNSIAFKTLSLKNFLHNSHIYLEDRRTTHSQVVMPYEVINTGYIFVH